MTERSNNELDKAVRSLEKLMATRFEAVQTAIDLARQELDRRLEGMNEFRDQLREQTATFVTREANDLLHKETERRMRFLEEAKANLDGRMWVIVAVFLLIQLGMVFFKFK